MTRTDDTRHGREESSPTDDRYAGFASTDGIVVYDTENAAAWIESDTTLDPAEVR